MIARRRRKWSAASTSASLMELALVFLMLASSNGLCKASIATEHVDVELEKLAKAGDKATIRKQSALGSLQVEQDGSANQKQAAVIPSISHYPAEALDSDSILASAAASGPPIYRSAPKQVDLLAGQPAGRTDGQLVQLSKERAPSRRDRSSIAPEDLNTAANHHRKKKHKKKKKKKKKIIIVKKKKKKKKKMKKHHEIKKKKKVEKKMKKKKKHMKKKKKHHKKKKKKVVMVKKKKKKKKKMMKKHSFHQHHYMPAHSQHERQDHGSSLHHQKEPSQHYHEPSHHHHEPSRHHKEASMPHGKYYEYRAVPQKGAWEFGFKRGNHKHMIERKEHGHRSHFKTTFNWKDKKGHGKHMFDYNHGDHKKHQYHAAAASQEAPSLAPLAASG